MGTSNHSDALRAPSDAAVLHGDNSVCMRVHSNSIVVIKAVDEGAVVQGGLGTLEDEEGAVAEFNVGDVAATAVAYDGPFWTHKTRLMIKSSVEPCTKRCTWKILRLLNRIMLTQLPRFWAQGLGTNLT